MRRVLGDHDGERIALGLGPAGAANPVNVIFRMLRHVVIDHMADIRNVQPARRDIRGHEHFIPAVAKAFERLLAFLLGAVGMQHRHGVVCALQSDGRAVGPVLGAAENNDRIVFHPVEQFQQQVGLLRVGHRIDHMLHRLGRRAPGADFDGLRIMHRPLDERFNLRRHRGGKQRGMALARALVENAAHVRQETHVQHAVRLVQHQKFHLVHPHRPLLHVIEQAAGRGDHDVRARLQFIILPAITHAAKDDGGFQIREPGIIAKAGFHLGRELARWLQDEGARAAVLV